MNDMYTVRTFRENLREAFNKAEAGDEVIIERYGKKYTLEQIEYGPIKFVEAKPIKIGRVDDYNIYANPDGTLTEAYSDPTYTDPEDAA